MSGTAPLLPAVPQHSSGNLPAAFLPPGPQPLMGLPSPERCKHCLGPSGQGDPRNPEGSPAARSPALTPQPWPEGWGLRGQPRALDRWSPYTSDPFDLYAPLPTPDGRTNLRLLLKVRSLPSVFLISTLERHPPIRHQVRKRAAGGDSGGRFWGWRRGSWF